MSIQFKKILKPCPICTKPAIEKYHPFCSLRCANVDLSRWLSDGYAIAGQDDAEEDGHIPNQTQDVSEKSKENS